MTAEVIFGHVATSGFYFLNIHVAYYRFNSSKVTRSSMKEEELRKFEKQQLFCEFSNSSISNVLFSSQVKYGVDDLF